MRRYHTHPGTPAIELSTTINYYQLLSTMTPSLHTYRVHDFRRNPRSHSGTVHTTSSSSLLQLLIADPNRTEQCRRDPYRTELIRTNARKHGWKPAPNRTEPNRTEPNRTEPNRTEPNRTEPNRTEPQKRGKPQK